MGTQSGNSRVRKVDNIIDLMKRYTEKEEVRTNQGYFGACDEKQDAEQKPGIIRKNKNIRDIAK